MYWFINVFQIFFFNQTYKFSQCEASAARLLCYSISVQIKLVLAGVDIKEERQI